MGLQEVRTVAVQTPAAQAACRIVVREPEAE